MIPSDMPPSGTGRADARFTDRFFSRQRFMAMAAMVVLAVVGWVVYAPGLGGGFTFDDYPNIVDNALVQPAHASLAELSAAALSSPSSELKRPLASLSFAANYLASGLDASAMKATNIALHVLNAWLVFFLCRMLAGIVYPEVTPRRRYIAALVIALAWMIAPINLTAVLYVVQRMESLANLFVLAGLLGYLSWRQQATSRFSSLWQGMAWLLIPTALGLTAKETAVLLPLYALCAEAILFRFRYEDGRFAGAIACAYAVILIPPLVAGSLWIAPGLFDPRTWATRDFTLVTRLLSEPRILVDYLVCTLWPTASGLSFYHDDFVISSDALHPWTTLPAMVLLALIGCIAWRLRRSRPLVTLGIAWFFACHTLTGTVLPLELVYEHRNYFASLGVILAVADILASVLITSHIRAARAAVFGASVILLGWSLVQCVQTANAWGSPLGLAAELGRRGPGSPRAQYELGRAYIIDSHYQASSPSTELAYAPLERAAALPASSILPQQALIFFNARLGRPVDPAWWNSMRRKLSERPPTVQDESSLDALSGCLRQELCVFPAGDLDEAFRIALGHPRTTARLLAMYANFVWYSLDQHEPAIEWERRAVSAAPSEGAYRIRLADMLLQAGRSAEAARELPPLEAMNTGGRYDNDLSRLRLRTGNHPTHP